MKKTKTQRGSVIRNDVRKHSKADDLQHLILRFEPSVGWGDQEAHPLCTRNTQKTFYKVMLLKHKKYR